MYHQLLVVGRLGRDPEMRFTPAGQSVCNFSIATDKQYTDKNGEKVKRTIWLRVSTWGKVAESCNTYLKKGSLVLVEGELTADENGNPRVWTKQDGTSGASFEINAQNVRFLSKSEVSESVENTDEDAPF